jgi:hypothetical protein
MWYVHHTSSRSGMFNYLMKKSLLPYGNSDYSCVSPSGQSLPPHRTIALSSTLYLLDPAPPNHAFMEFRSAMVFWGGVGGGVEQLINP